MKLYRIIIILTAMILVNGCKQSEIQSQHQNENIWETKTPMQIKRAFHSMAAVQGNIYVMGGITGGHNEFLLTPAVEMYDPELNKWSGKADMPNASLLSCAVTINDKIYVFGGEEGESFDRTSALYEYDCSKDQWSKKASMNIARSFHCAVTLNNKIYAIGGRENNTEIRTKEKSSLAVYTIEEYDIDKDKWTIKTILPFKHFTVGAAAINNKIYILSDTTSNAMRDEFAVLEEYDPQTNTFITRANLIPSKCDAAMTAYKNKIYVFGGWYSGALSTVEEYDVENDKWTEKPVLPYIAQNLQAVTLEDKIYITGGIRYPARNVSEKRDDLLMFNPD